MKKKLALSIISLDECFTKKGFSGGGHKVSKRLIEGLVESGKFDIDIFCQKSCVDKIDGVNSITVLSKKTFANELKEKIDTEKYDYILSSDILLPFANNIIHSNSSKFKSKNSKGWLHKQILLMFNSKKIKKQEKNLPRDKAIFAVSESLRKDFIENFNLDEDKVFAAIPAIDNYCEFVPPEKKNDFIFGSIVGGGLNKGGQLLLAAMVDLPKNIKARVIFPKFKKSFFFRALVNLLGLKNRVEVLPRQADMDSYYKTIDCYVLPSLNEAFGLVVTEAASHSKPSIVSSTTGVRELIKDGENGFVFVREKTPTKNLNKKLKEVSDMYFNDYEKFVEISKNAHSTSQSLDWKEFTDTIINNMIEEK